MRFVGEIGSPARGLQVLTDGRSPEREVQVLRDRDSHVIQCLIAGNVQGVRGMWVIARFGGRSLDVGTLEL